ncbi:MAG: hypothetical protein AAGL68_03675 [Pseudomonadota bacterium]
MAIEYVSERKAYLDSENGAYVTFEQDDRDYWLTNYYLFNRESTFQIGALVQKYVADFIGDLDNATRWQYIVITAWQPNTSMPKNREILGESNPRIQRLGQFIFADHWGALRPRKAYGLNLLSTTMGKNQ